MISLIGFDLLLRLIGLMNIMPTLSRPVNIQGRQHYLAEFITRTFNICLCSVVYKAASLKITMMIDYAELCNFTSPV